MNDREWHERVSALFLELRPLPSGDRIARLHLLADGDDRLRSEVLSLLEHDQETVPTFSDSGRRIAQPLLSDELPPKIGPYIVLKRIGRGGFGYVLLAEQHEPVRRQVAIKVVPHAAVNPDYAARFEFERRALERAAHPNIAHILDAGRTADGLPYLVMDYVPGVPITEYCDANGLGLRDRISLLLTVADAVQHAHQRGVIHRDLKPANIFVEEVSGKPVPRVLDFGIAKPTPESMFENSPVSIGQPLGTPAYMAPEQTGGQAVDTRADVYSLGAILYELVSGRTPVDAAAAGAGSTSTQSEGLFEVLKRVREETPPPASRAKTSNPGKATATHMWSRAMWADLDCILAKALEKAPSRRYQSVGAFADDLSRLLRHEPISARPATWRYRTARFCRRHQALVASVAVILLAMLVGIVGLSWGLVEANRQRREALYQFDAQRELNRFLTDDLLAAASPEHQGKDVKVIELLDRAAKRVDSRFAQRPLIAASVHHALGNAYMEMGEFDRAQTHIDKAIETRRSVAGNDAMETLHSEIAEASLAVRRQNYSDATKRFHALIPRARIVLGADNPVLYAALNDLGVAYLGMDRGSDALELLKEALAGRARLLGSRDQQVLVTTGNLALAYQVTGQFQQSIDMIAELIQVAESLDDPPHLLVLGLYNNVGAICQDLGRNEEARRYLAKAVERATQWLGPRSPETLTIQSNLAALEAKTGDPVRAIEIYQTLVASLTDLYGSTAYDTLVARFGLHNAMWYAKRFDDAAAGFRTLLPDCEKSLEENHFLRIQTRSSLARALRDGGHVAEAQPIARQAADEFLRFHGPDNPRTKTTRKLADEIDAALAANPSTSQKSPSNP